MEFSDYSKVVYDNADVTITVAKVSHKPVHPVFGYRIDYKDRSIFISGDTAYDARIADYAKNVDVLFHEALNMEMVQTMQKAAAGNNANGREKILLDIPRLTHLTCR